MRIAPQTEVPGLTEALQRLAPAIKPFVQSSKHAPDEPVRADVLLGVAAGGPQIRDIIKRCEGMRWVHFLGTGADKFPLHLVRDRQLTCSRGASAVPIVEWVMAMLLAHEKQLPDRWISEPPPVWFKADLGCLALPATPENDMLISAKAMGVMKSGAHLVNVSRASLVEQEALRVNLDTGQIGRASLDVVEPEPLPAGDWMYQHPRVFLSPHIFWSGPNILERLTAPFLANVAAFLKAEPLQGVVDMAAGYQDSDL